MKQTKKTLNEELNTIKKMIGLGESSAKYQFSQDLQDDPDYTQFKKDALYKDDRGGEYSDPFISKTKYSRVGFGDVYEPESDEEIGEMLDMTRSMDELDMVSDTNSEANSFLADVKARVPEIYSRVYGVYRNRGLEAAKELFAQYDPVVIKQKEKERKSAETKDRAKAKIADMRSLMLSKEELVEMIERIVLNEDYRRACQRLNFPQLVSSNFVPKVSVSQRDLKVGLSITSTKSYSPGPAGMIKFANDIKKNDTDSILDDIIQLKKEFSSNEKFKKMAKKGGYYDGEEVDDWYWRSKNVFLINTLRMSYGVSNWGSVVVDAGGSNKTLFSIMAHDEEELIKTEPVYKSKRMGVEDLSKAVVVGIVESMLFALHRDMMRLIAKMEQSLGAMGIMRKGEQNPGLNENDLGVARDEYYTKLDKWHKDLHNFTEASWKEMFNYLLSLDMSNKEAFALIYTDEYKKLLKSKESEWLKQNPEPKFTYDSGAQITKEQIIDILVTALEGGSNYWYLIKDLPKEVKSNKSMGLSEVIGEYILNGGDIDIYDLEDEDEILGDLNMNKLLEAITIMKAEYPDMYQNLVNDEYDANDADIFFQIAVMGEVTFG